MCDSAVPLAVTAVSVTACCHSPPPTHCTSFAVSGRGPTTLCLSLGLATVEARVPGLRSRFDTVSPVGGRAWVHRGGVLSVECFLAADTRSGLVGRALGHCLATC